MKNLILIVFVLFTMLSCKKTYTCQCYSDRRGYVILQQIYTYNESSKNTAFVKCTSDYESSANYTGGYCEIK